MDNEIVYEEVNEELVILNLNGGMYYSTNKVGTKVYKLLKKNKTTQEIVNTLKMEFPETDFKIIQKTVEDFKNEILAEKLL